MDWIGFTFAVLPPFTITPMPCVSTCERRMPALQIYWFDWIWFGVRRLLEVII